MSIASIMGQIRTEVRRGAQSEALKISLFDLGPWDLTDFVDDGWVQEGLSAPPPAPNAVQNFVCKCISPLETRAFTGSSK